MIVVVRLRLLTNRVCQASRGHLRALSASPGGDARVRGRSRRGSADAAARAAGTGQLQQQISAGQSKISGLAGAVSTASGQIAQLQASIAPLQARLVSIQSDLDAKRAALLRLRSQLSAARTRLSSLEAFEARGERVLARQLVSSYESDRPDLISVVLDAHGFSDLLERVAFASRVRRQDVQVVSQVRSARRRSLPRPPAWARSRCASRRSPPASSTSATASPRPA